jgi:cell division transport system ATP-binding protein
MLKIKNVKKTFGSIVALSSVSFDVEDGEFVFITGPSGSGKTTLLRLILGEFSPDSGQILFDKTDIAKLKKKDVPKIRQKIGVVFQDFKVLVEKTVRENVEIALAVIQVAQNEWPQRVEHVLKLVGLDDRSELFPSQLSGGELQRVSLARALAVNPKLILADEPTGNLDWDTAEQIMNLFEEINKEGKSVVMATHHKLLVKNHLVSSKNAKLKRKVIELKKGGREKSSQESKTKE